MVLIDANSATLGVNGRAAMVLIEPNSATPASTIQQRWF